MNKNSSEDSASAKARQASRRLPKRTIFLGGITGVLILILIALPMVAKRVATTWLQDNGASSAHIENIDINLFTGTVRLFDLDASGSDQQRFHIGEAELGVRWWPLASKRIVLEALLLTDAEIDISTPEPGAWQIGGILLRPADPADEERESSTFDWDFGSERIAFNNISLTYQDTVFDTDIEINQLIIGTHSTWLAEEKTDFSLDMQLNGAPVVLNSEVTPWAQQRSLVGQISVSEVELADHALALQSLAGLENTRGTVNLDINVGISLDEQGALELVISGPLSLSDLGLALDSLVLTNEQINWQGQLALKLPAGQDEAMLSAQGGINIAGTQVSLAGVMINNALLDWQGEMILSSPDAVFGSSLQVDGTLNVQETAAVLSSMVFENQTLDWQGNLVLNLAEQASPLLSLDGTLGLAGSKVALDELELNASTGSLGFMGNANFTPAYTESSLPGLSLNASLNGQALVLNHKGLLFDLASLSNFNIDGIKVEALSEITVDRVALEDLSMLAVEQNSAPLSRAVFAFDHLALEQINFTLAESVRINSITLNEPVIAIVRNEEGEFERISELLALYVEQDELEEVEEVAAVEEVEEIERNSESESSQSVPQLSLAINSMDVQSQQILSFEDRSVTPAVNFPLNELIFTLNQLDTASSSPAAVQFLVGNESMTLEVNGNVVAFPDLPSASLVAKLSSVDLPQFSAYIPGYNIDRGRFSADSNISIIEDALDIQNTVVLERLTLSGKAADGNDILSQGMAMPLDVALDLLRDSDDRIELALPVTGSLADPQFSSADIIRTVMQNAIQNAAMSYVTNALQPLGTLLFIKNIAGKAAQPRFAPVAMNDGEAELSATAREYLLKIGDLLTERPKMVLTLCGVATDADRQVLMSKALAEAAQTQQEESGLDTSSEEARIQVENIVPQISDSVLLQLAAQRTVSSIKFLIEEVNIAEERLFSCRETIDNGEDASPQVQISL